MEAPPQLRTKPMMSFQDAVKQVLRKYADFSGRATRAEFWWWKLAVYIASFILAIIDGSILSFSQGGAYSPLQMIFGLAILLPSLAVTARRLHDIGKTGWWQLVWIAIAVIAWIPFIIGLIVLLVRIFGVLEGGWFSYAQMGEGNFSGGPSFGVFLDVSVPLIIGLVISLLVTLAIVIWAILWLARQGQTGPNRFGPDPRALDEPVPPATDAIE